MKKQTVSFVLHNMRPPKGLLLVIWDRLEGKLWLTSTLYVYIDDGNIDGNEASLTIIKDSDGSNCSTCQCIVHQLRDLQHIHMVFSMLKLTDHSTLPSFNKMMSNSSSVERLPYASKHEPRICAGYIGSTGLSSFNLEAIRPEIL